MHKQIRKAHLEAETTMLKNRNFFPFKTIPAFLREEDRRRLVHLLHPQPSPAIKIG